MVAATGTLVARQPTQHHQWRCGRIGGADLPIPFLPMLVVAFMETCKHRKQHKQGSWVVLLFSFRSSSSSSHRRGCFKMTCGHKQHSTQQTHKSISNFLQICSSRSFLLLLLGLFWLLTVGASFVWWPWCCSCSFLQEEKEKKREMRGLAAQLRSGDFPSLIYHRQWPSKGYLQNKTTQTETKSKNISKSNPFFSESFFFVGLKLFFSVSYGSWGHGRARESWKIVGLLRRGRGTVGKAGVAGRLG